MKYIKLFESYNIKDKIDKANKLLFEFELLKVLKTLNFKFIKIKKSEEEDLYFYYEKNERLTNISAKLIGFVQQKGLKRIGFFDAIFLTRLGTLAFISNSDLHWKFLKSSNYADALKEHLNLQEFIKSSNQYIQKQYDINIHKYESTPPISKGNLTDKIISWLDSGKQTTKDEFFRSNNLLKHSDVYAGDDFEIPKNYYHGYNSKRFAQLRRDGLIDFKRKGRNIIMVKGENFDAIKAKKNLT